MAEIQPHRLRILPGYTPTIVNETDIFPNSQEDVPYNDTRYTATKFGGLSPFFNPGAHWPLCGCCRRPQTFVGQINLEDKEVPLPIRERLGIGGGEGIFQLFWCPDDGVLETGCRWRVELQDRIRACFVKPQCTTKTTPPSLTDLAARRIADEILSEDPPLLGPTHSLLADIPQHLRNVVKTLVDDIRAEKVAMQQRKYCVEALRSVKKYLAFDHRHFNPAATSRGIQEGDDREVDENLGTVDGDEGGAYRRFLWFRSVEKFVDWKEWAVEIDNGENESEEFWTLQDVDPPATCFVDGYEFPPHRYLFLGWPRWNPGGPCRYPPCPMSPEHGLCKEPILASYAVEAFDGMLESDGGWFLLLKCPKCTGFGVSDENPCLH